MCTTVGEIERAVAAFAQSPNGGLIVTGERVGKRSSRTDHFRSTSVEEGPPHRLNGQRPVKGSTLSDWHGTRRAADCQPNDSVATLVTRTARPHGQRFLHARQNCVPRRSPQC
jgi:hypothetical protein